jgi:hypothetical protein
VSVEAAVFMGDGNLHMRIGFLIIVHLSESEFRVSPLPGLRTADDGNSNKR